MIRIGQFFQSFRHALRGIAVVFRDEQSFRIQVLAGAVALGLARYFRINNFQLLVILALIAFVLILEIINSIFERFIDSFKPRIHPVVRDIKDIMAGAVLIASAVSAVVGAVIFWPHLKNLL